jgi:hypothetical protein
MALERPNNHAASNRCLGWFIFTPITNHPCYPLYPFLEQPPKGLLALARKYGRKEGHSRNNKRSHITVLGFRRNDDLTTSYVETISRLHAVLIRSFSNPHYNILILETVDSAVY